MEDIKKMIRNIPDFPKKGIMFRDITTAVKDPSTMKKIIDYIADEFKDAKIDYVAGIESRGFIFGVPIAYSLHKGFVPIRKKGKLPLEVISKEYALEYGSSVVEMHKDSIKPGQKVVVVDDLIATGGTIASKISPEGLQPGITSEELLAYVPEVRENCMVDTVQPFELDSTNICQEHWLILEQIIEKSYNSYDGFVICHGTDTMAYTAAALSYLIQNNRKPIVVTGAQKPINLEITDARMNLRDSLRFVMDDRAYGVNIVFGGKVIAGTRAKKERSKSYNAFSSINYPDIAVIQEKRIIFYIEDYFRLTEQVRFYHRMNERVLLLKIIPGMDGRILNTLADEYDAVIIESFGVGGLPAYGRHSFLEAVDNWCSRGKKVIMATQVIHEGSDMEVYQVGKVIKDRFPIIEAFDMTLEATVTKVMWLLGNDLSNEEFKKEFYRTINYDILLAE